MEKSSNLKNLELEYAMEIKSGEIALDDLYSLGLQKTDLDSEIFLRQIYGDETLKRNITEVEDTSAEKSVQKIEEKDINLSKSLTREFESIEADDFISALDALNAKLGR